MKSPSLGVSDFAAMISHSPQGDSHARLPDRAHWWSSRGDSWSTEVAMPAQDHAHVVASHIIAFVAGMIVTTLMYLAVK